MDIFEHIMKEHREVEGMLQKLAKGQDAGVFNKLRLSLNAHMEAEEASLYPAMEDVDSEIVEHANEEHAEIREILKVLNGKQGSDFTSMISKLTEVINDHVRDEEEDMFPQAKESFDPETVMELSGKFDEVDERMMRMAR